MTTALESSLVKCSKCQALLSPQQFNIGNLTLCPSCQSLLEIEVFPAILIAPTAVFPEPILVEGESSCFYHPQKKAVLPCQGCGRFLCALCDCELNGQHFCPACLETGKTKGKIKSLENQRTLYDSIALSLAIYPLLIFYFTLVTAPASLFVAIRYWNAPRSIVRRTKTRYVTAIVLSSMQIAGWGVLFVFLSTRHRS